jgi:hypothetical protein
MRDKQCDVIRRELEELRLNDEFSVAAAAEHMRGCADCREFQRQQTKLRQIIGGLGTVNAPADFDFRLRARLAADSEGSAFRYWAFATKGLATAAILVVFGVGAVVVWQRTRPEPAVAVAPRQEEPRQEEPRQQEPSRPEAPVHTDVRDATPVVADNTTPSRKVDRAIVHKPRRPVTAVDFSSERANIVSNTQPTLDTATVFPIEASLQSFKVSLDDGRGNARTISFPTVTFGSQRVLATGNQFAPKGVW